MEIEKIENVVDGIIFFLLATISTSQMPRAKQPPYKRVLSIQRTYRIVIHWPRVTKKPRVRFER